MEVWEFRIQKPCSVIYCTYFTLAATLIVWHYILSFVKMFCLVVSQVLNRVYLIHRFPLEIASPNLFPHMPLPGSSFWWVGPGEVLCNQMHHCVSQRKMSWERGREAGRGRKRERVCVWIDHTTVLGEARVTSHEMAAVPGVGATITHSSLALARLGFQIRIYIQYIMTINVSWWWGMCMSVHFRTPLTCVWFLSCLRTQSPAGRNSSRMKSNLIRICFTPGVPGDCN